MSRRWLGLVACALVVVAGLGYDVGSRVAEAQQMRLERSGVEPVGITQVGRYVFVAMSNGQVYRADGEATTPLWQFWGQPFADARPGWK